MAVLRLLGLSPYKPIHDLERLMLAATPVAQLRGTYRHLQTAGTIDRRYMQMTRRKVWMSSPHAGGSPIPPPLQEETRRRIITYADRHYEGRFERIDVRFRGRFCYLDAYCEPEPPTKALLRVRGETRDEYYQRLREIPIHLCRMRYFAGRRLWSVAFYTYSHERYEATFFPNGELYGTPEEAFDLGAVYLQ